MNKISVYNITQHADLQLITWRHLLLERHLYMLSSSAQHTNTDVAGPQNLALTCHGMFMVMIAQFPKCFITVSCKFFKLCKYLKCILNKKKNTNQQSDWHINSSQLTHHATGRFIKLNHSHDNINQFISLQYFEKCRFVCPVSCQPAPRTIDCLQYPCALPLFI